jgi:hypothetical protein
MGKYSQCSRGSRAKWNYPLTAVSDERSGYDLSRTGPPSRFELRSERIDNLYDLPHMTIVQREADPVSPQVGSSPRNFQRRAVQLQVAQGRTCPR